MRNQLICLLFLLLLSTPAGADTNFGDIPGNEPMHTAADDDATFVPLARTISTTAPLTGGGDLSANRTLAVSAATTTAVGVVELATSGESAANVAVQGNDARMSDSRTPTAHAASHASGGSDPVKLDDLAAPDDNTDLNVSTTKHGLTPKLSGVATEFLTGTGTYATPSGVSDRPLSTFEPRLGFPSGSLGFVTGGGGGLPGAAAGSIVDIAGSDVDVIAFACDPANNRITSTGADAGAGAAASTVYYVYVSNASATTFPSDLRLSTVAPSDVGSILYLGTSGNALNWRFCGMAYTNASTAFQDDETFRGVSSHYNRIPLSLRVCPAYSDNSADTTWTGTSTTWAPANGGTGSKITFIGGPGASTELYLVAHGVGSLSIAGTFRIGISALSSTTNAEATAIHNAAAIVPMTCSVSMMLTTGRFTVDLLYSVSGGTGTYYADTDDMGGTTDPRTTQLTGWIMG